MAEFSYPEHKDHEIFPLGSDFKFSHIIVVNGMAGNRSDFVAGWLANAGHPNIKTQPWYIEPVWGKSLILSQWNLRMAELHPFNRSDEKELTRRQHQFAYQFNLRYDPSAPIIVTKSHWTSKVWGGFIPDQCLPHMTFLDILMSDADKPEVYWQHFCKNCLCWLDRYDSIDKKDAIKKTIQQLFANYSDVIEFSGDLLSDTLAFQEHLQSNPPIPVLCNTPTDRDDMDLVTVNYGDLWHGPGPAQLIDRFDLPAQSLDIWNTCAPLSRGPDRVYCLDRWWQPW